MRRHRWLVLAAGLVFVGAMAVPLLGAAERGREAVAEKPATSPARGLDDLVGVRSPVTLSLREATLEAAFRELGGATSIRFRLVDELKADSKDKISLAVTQIPTRKVLEQLAREHRLQYVVVDPWTVEVRRAEPVFISGVGGVTNPQLIEGSKVQPAYPADAREAHAEGSVILQVLIGADGTVDSVEPLKQSRPEYAFAEAAEEAIRQWRYEPATANGVPVAVYFTVFVEFKLDSSKAAPPS